MINFLQQGGQTTKKQSSNNLEKGVMLFVQALALTLLADPQLIILAALANPEALKSAALVYLLTQDIQQAAQTFAQAMLSQTQAARHGAKLSYLKNLKHQCPEDEELYYFKKGGKAGCGCRKKEDGGKVENKKESIISKFKKACGGSKIKLKKHKLGGSLKSIPFYQGGTTKNGIITSITSAGSLSTPGIVDFSKFSNSIPKVPNLPQAPVLSEPKLKFTLYNPEATFNAEEAYNSALGKAVLDNGGHMGRRAIRRFRQQWDTTGRWDAQNDWEAKQHQAYMNELDMRQQYIKNRNAELLKAMMDKVNAPVLPIQVETPVVQNTPEQSFITNYWLSKAKPYGFNTIDEIKEWLKQHELEPDGKFGEKSIEKYFLLTEGQRPSITIDPNWFSYQRLYNGWLGGKDNISDSGLKYFNKILREHGYLRENNKDLTAEQIKNLNGYYENILPVIRGNVKPK